MLSILCKVGKIQLTDTCMLQVVPLFGSKIIWQAPASSIVGLTAQPSSIGAVNVTIQTNQGTYYVAETVSKPNFEKLQAAFPHLQAQMAGKEWYCNPTALTHVATYTDQRQMQREVEAAAQYGWIPQSQSSQAGKSSAAKVIGGALLLGPVGALAGAASRGKGTITVTFVRSPEWHARRS